MSTVRYSTKIRNSSYSKSTEYSFDRLRYGESPKMTESETIHSSDSNYSRIMSDGWMSRPLFEDMGGSVVFPNDKIIRDGRQAFVELNGPCVTAVNHVTVDSRRHRRMLNGNTVLGVKSRKDGPSSRAFTFRRRDGKLSVHSEYIFKDESLAVSELGDDEYTEITQDGNSFIVFNSTTPSSISSIRGVDASLEINDYLEISMDWTKGPLLTGMSEYHYLESCDYTSLESLRAFDWTVPDSEVVLKAEFFPIYNHVSVVAKLQGGMVQMGIVYPEYVDSNSGTVSFPGSWIGSLDTDTHGECLGFYLFYGVVPSVYLNPERLVVRDYSLLSDQASLSHWGVNLLDKEGGVSLSENTLTIIRDNEYSSAATTMFAPLRIGEIFIEPEHPVRINGEVYTQERPLVAKNNGPIKLEFSFPDHLIDMLTPITGQVPSGIAGRTPVKILIPSQTSSEATAIYGLFRVGSVRRFTMMSSWSPLSVGDTNSLPLAPTGFGAGTLSHYQSAITYLHPTVSILNTDTPDISLEIVPERDGFEFILPAWTKLPNVTVVERSSSGDVRFTDWSFINPDVLILDKEKVVPSRTYIVTVEVEVSPVIQNINLTEGSLDVIMNSNPMESYGSQCMGLYLLSSKDFRVRTGYIGPLGEKHYFPNNINISILISKNYLERVVLGLKSIFF